MATSAATTSAHATPPIESSGPSARMSMNARVLTIATVKLTALTLLDHSIAYAAKTSPVMARIVQMLMNVNKTSIIAIQMQPASTNPETFHAFASQASMETEQHAVILMSAHWILTIAALMQIAPIPLEISHAIASQVSLEMEQHALMLMSAHWIKTIVILMQTAPTSSEVSVATASRASLEMGIFVMV